MTQQATRRASNRVADGVTLSGIQAAGAITGVRASERWERAGDRSRTRAMGKGMIWKSAKVGGSQMRYRIGELAERPGDLSPPAIQ